MPSYGTAQGKKTLVPQTTLSVRAPESEAAMLEVPAILDSGATMTAVPSDLVPKLSGFLEMDWRPVTGPLGEKKWLPVYTVDLRIGACEFRNRKVTVVERPYALVGRDILNQYRVVLDGPAKEWTHNTTKA